MWGGNPLEVGRSHPTIIDQLQHLWVTDYLAEFEASEERDDKSWVEITELCLDLCPGEDSCAGCFHAVLTEILWGKDAAINFTEKFIDVKDDPTLVGVLFVLEE